MTTDLVGARIETKKGTRGIVRGVFIVGDRGDIGLLIEQDGSHELTTVGAVGVEVKR